jgi:hypothetical protein
MTNERSGLQQLLIRIADLAAARRIGPGAENAPFYAQLHAISTDVAQMMSERDLDAAFIPPLADSMAVAAAEFIHDRLVIGADVAQYDPAVQQVREYGAMISALPGQSTTGGGSFLRSPAIDDAFTADETEPLPGESTTEGGSF